MVSRILSGLVLFSALSFGAATPTVRWTMINVSPNLLQGDAHLLEFIDGKIILVDAGDDADVLVPYLKSKNIKQIDRILVSHGHKDHYRGIPKILDGGIKIREVRMNFPTKVTCDREKPWGCDWKDIELLRTFLEKNKIPIYPEKKGEIYHSGKNGRLEVLYAFDGEKTPVGRTDLNDMSVILKLSVGKSSVLFTGDLNQSMGTYLAKNGKNLKATILKVPHHGAESVAPNSFFDKVSPEIALVPGPKHLWEGERAKRLRDYFGPKKIATYVSGQVGHVEVSLSPTGYEVKSEKALPVGPSLP